MNKLKDNDLREALRRREAKRQPTAVPDDFCDRVMQEIDDDRRPSRTWLYAAVAIAASALLIVTLRMGRVSELEQTAPGQPLTAGQIVTPEPPTVDINKVPAAQPVAIAKPLKIKKQPTVPTDSMALQVARIEAEMQHVSDSCYMDLLARTIENDPQLSQMVDEFINMASDTAQATVCIKSI